MNFSLRTQIIIFNAAIIAFVIMSLGVALLIFARGALIAQIDHELEGRLPPIQAQSLPPTPKPRLPHFRNQDDDFFFGDGPPAGMLPFQDAPPRSRNHRGGHVPHFNDDFYQTIRPRRFHRNGVPVFDLADTPFDDEEFKRAAENRIIDLKYSDIPGRPPQEPGSRPSPPLRLLTARRSEDLIDQIVFPVEEVNRSMRGLTLTLLALLPIGLLMAAVGSYFLTNRVLRPVQTATRAAAALGAEAVAGEDARLPVTGKDEFGELASTFNGLLDRLAVAFQKQERLLEQQKRFTADASHELKTPLTAIQGNATYALSLSDNNPNATLRRKEALTDIAAAATDMSALVQNLLLLARADSGNLGHNASRLPISEIVQRARFRAGIGTDSGPVFEERIETLERDPIFVVGNADELTRLFANLFDNARRHTQPEGKITVTTQVSDHTARIVITDTGEGIAPEHLPHLGERFYRADASRTRAENELSGTGLGLAICRSITEAHGGTLQIASELGKGTTVTVTLPLSREANE